MKRAQESTELPDDEVSSYNNQLAFEGVYGPKRLALCSCVGLI